jgi:hypothetical protein
MPDILAFATTSSPNWDEFVTKSLIRGNTLVTHRTFGQPRLRRVFLTVHTFVGWNTVE